MPEPGRRFKGRFCLPAVLRGFRKGVHGIGPPPTDVAEAPRLPVYFGILVMMKRSIASHRLRE